MNSMLETLCLMLDGNLDMPTEITYSKVWFALEHPKVKSRLLFVCVCVCFYTLIFHSLLVDCECLHICCFLQILFD